MQSISSIDRIVFRTEAVTIGAFRCPRDHPRFMDSGPIAEYCFVFPRSAVTIEHEHARPFVANPNVVTMYNQGQRYVRGPISREGDCCDWFGVDARIARDVLRAFDPAVDDRPRELFLVPNGRPTAALYLMQRQVYELAGSGEAVDPIAIEELVVSLLERVVESSVRPGANAAEPRPRRFRSEATQHVERLLSERSGEGLRLTELAREVGLSVYHLCRSFRSETGTTIHQYRHQLRLRSSLEPVRRTDRRLVDVALQLGFSSHSHFTSAFRREFGVSPSNSRRSRHGPSVPTHADTRAD